jgi:hypothetical protein
MAKITAAFFVLLAVIANNASAQEKMLHLQTPCAPYLEMANLADKNGEEVLFIGEGLTFASGTSQPLKGGMFFTVNQDEGNWTMFQLFGDGMACMLFNGGKFQPYMGKKQ